MAITATPRTMDARRDSETMLSSSTINNSIVAVGGEADEGGVVTKSLRSTSTLCQPCQACPYCSDTCGDATCAPCDLKLTKLEEPSSATNSPCGVVVRSGSCNLPSYTMCEIRRHNRPDSCWLVAGDTIYDATDYMTNHPGGQRSILNKSGGVCDCTMDIQFHSKNGRRVWNKYRIGKVKKCPGPGGVGASGEERQWWMFWL